MLRRFAQTLQLVVVCLLLFTALASTSSSAPHQRNGGHFLKKLSQRFSLSSRSSTNRPLNPTVQSAVDDMKVETIEDGPEMNLTETWWPLWWGRETADQKVDSNATAATKVPPKEQEHQAMNTSSSTEKPIDEKEEPKDDDKKKKRPKSKRQQKKKSHSQKEEPAQEEKKDKKPTEEKEEIDETVSSSATGNTSSTGESSPPQTTNATKPDSEKPAQPPPSPNLPRSRVVVLGGHPSGMGGMGGPPQGFGGMGGHPNQLTPQQQQQLRNAATSLAIAEIIASLFANGFRLFVALWAARHFANRIETIQPTQHFVFERLNDRFVRDTIALKRALDEPPDGIHNARWQRIMTRRSRKEPGIFSRPNLDTTFVRTVVVVDFGNNSDGGLDLKYLANIVSFLISQHRAKAFGVQEEEEQTEDQEGTKGTKNTTKKPLDLEIVFNINSPGGSVATFGLAAAQIQRLRREHGIKTTVCVDKYAASGGYMIASQADYMIAAPFATVGSVGVIMEGLNFHDLLRQYGVQPMVLKAGNSKNPLTTYGAVTKQDMELEQERLEKVHVEFQRFTIAGRPQLQSLKEQVCDGSVYMGQEAKALNLVDSIMTSDEYLMERMIAGDRVLKIHRSHQSRLAPHLRFPTIIDILPHLKARIQNWVSHPDATKRLLQAGSMIGFVFHVISTHMAKAAGNQVTNAV